MSKSVTLEEYQELLIEYDNLEDQYYALLENTRRGEELDKKELAMKFGDAEFWYDQYSSLDGQYWKILEALVSILGLEQGKVSMNDVLKLLREKLNDQI